MTLDEVLRLIKQYKDVAHTCMLYERAIDRAYEELYEASTLPTEQRCRNGYMIVRELGDELARRALHERRIHTHWLR